MAPHRYSPSSAVQSESSGTTSTYYGEPHAFDPSFRGPVRSRSCTDLLCCVLFVLVLLSYSLLGLVAWLHGDPRKVIHPTDSRGQFCGQPGTPNEDKLFLFYFNLLKCANPAILINLQCPTTQMCVSRCPSKFLTYSEVQQQQRLGLGRSSWEDYRHFCRAGFNKPLKPVSQVLRDEDCPSMLVPSRPVLRRCLPDLSSHNGSVTVANKTQFVDALEKARSVSELQEAARGITGLLDTREMGLKIMEDYAKSWFWILMGLLMALVVSLIFILVLRFTAGLLLWVTILAFILLLAYGIWVCVLELSRLRNSPGSEVTITELGLHTDLQLYLQLQQTWTLLLVCLGSAEVAVLLVLLFMRRRVRIAIALLREASKAIGRITSTLFYPVVTFILLTSCVAYWALTAVHLSSSGEAVYKVMAPDESCPQANSTCNPETFSRSSVHSAPSCAGAQCLFAFYGGETPFHRHLPLLQIANLIVFLWLLNFSLALEQCTLAGAFASYYWAQRRPQDLPPCPVYSSFSRALRYHIGSLAFGSLVLSLVQFVRILLEYLETKLKGLNNSVSHFVLCCLSCCFWCLDRFLRYMNHNAYIMVALYGKNFCTSARNAFFLLMRNVVRVAVVDRLTDVLLFLGKVLIAAAVGAVAFCFFTKKLPVLQDEVPQLNYYWVPLLTVVLGAYLIAHGFFSVYAMCVDTLFLCFCDDLERNDGSPERPYFMSPELHRILGKPH
ncbi:choline transporter-like protein 5-A [Periophthalmus magnuspinnatus]|uniref:choline transporter-like protein 5-A n=1 Tax=Periophthalmus magnuspinnatus TaxID=409849 RepID=UPI00145B839F|nr:choline transporter-like protein 5-A [Periophthalmus magnuspinnatus]